MRHPTLSFAFFLAGFFITFAVLVSFANASCNIYTNSDLNSLTGGGSVNDYITGVPGVGGLPVRIYSVYASGGNWSSMNGQTGSCGGGQCLYYTDSIIYVISVTSNNDSACTTYVSEPSTCTDGLLDGDESGVDCGGSCSAVCTNVCAGSETLMTFTDATGSAQNGCVAGLIPADSTGRCPDNNGSYNYTYRTTGDPGMCYTWEPVTYGSAASGALLPPPPAVPTNPYGTSTSKTSSTTTSSVVNPDGTTTTTTNQTSSLTQSDGTVIGHESDVGQSTANADGSTDVVDTHTTTRDVGGSSVTTTTTTTSHLDSSGNVVSSNSSTTTGSTDDGKTASTVSTSDAPSGSVDGTRVDKFGSRMTQFVSDIQSAPVYGAFTNITTLPADPGGSSNAFSVSLGSWGSAPFDLDDYSGIIDVLGWILVGISLLVTARLVIANK